MGAEKLSRFVLAWQIIFSRLVILFLVVTPVIVAVILLSMAREPRNMVIVVNWNEAGQKIDRIEVQSKTWKWSDTIQAETNGRFSIADVPHHWEHGDVDVSIHLRGPADESVVIKKLRAVGRNGNTLCIELHDASNVTIDWNCLVGQVKR